MTIEGAHQACGRACVSCQVFQGSFRELADQTFPSRPGTSSPHHIPLTSITHLYTLLTVPMGVFMGHLDNRTMRYCCWRVCDSVLVEAVMLVWV